MAVRAHLRFGAALGALVAGTCAAVAQSQSTGIEEIIVTADKRAENVQDVPSSVFVATPEILERTTVRDFDDLTRIAPDLTIAKTTQPANNSINIRGVGTYAFSIATESSVAVVVDDVPQSFQAEAFNALTDAAQVEVLRGPQSSLFGKAASAGVINIITNAPTDTFSAGAQAFGTTDGEYRGNAFVSGPVTDGVKARLTLGYDNYKGDLYNVYNNTWVDGHSDFNARTRVEWDPNSDWTFMLTSYYDNTRATCCTEAWYFVSPGVTYGSFGGFKAPYAAILNGVTPGSNNRQISADVNPAGNAVDMGIDLKADYQIGGGYTVSSITGYDRYDLHDLQDTDFTSFNWGPGGANVAGATAVGGSANGGFFQISSVTQEIRLVSPSTDRFRYVAGFFFSKSDGEADFVRGTNTLGQDGVLTTVPPTTSLFASYLDHAYDLNYALYGQSTFDITKALGLVTGIRFNREDLNYTFDDRVHNIVFGATDCSTKTLSGPTAKTCDEFDSITGRAELEYHITPDVMVFGGYDRGNKGAAFDLTSTLGTRSLVGGTGPDKLDAVGDSIAAKQPIKPEQVHSFQVGYKSELFDHQVIWNVTAFDEVFHDFQAQSKDPNTLQNELNSLGAVTTKGVESELTADPYPGLSLNVDASYDDAHINSFLGAACFPSQTAALGCVGSKQNIFDARLNNAPRWNLNLNGEYDKPIAGDYTLFVTSSWHWQSSEIFSILQDPDSLQKSYGIFDLGVGFETGQWKVTLFCNNVFDQNYALDKGRNSTWNISPYAATGATDAIFWTPGRDSVRYFGIQLGFTH